MSDIIQKKIAVPFVFHAAQYTPSTVACILSIGRIDGSLPKVLNTASPLLANRRLPKEQSIQ